MPDFVRTLSKEIDGYVLRFDINESKPTIRLFINKKPKGSGGVSVFVEQSIIRKPLLWEMLCKAKIHRCKKEGFLEIMLSDALSIRIPEIFFQISPINSISQTVLHFKLEQNLEELLLETRIAVFSEGDNANLFLLGEVNKEVKDLLLGKVPFEKTELEGFTRYIDVKRSCYKQ